jgi:hypothetical protein
MLRIKEHRKKKETEAKIVMKKKEHDAKVRQSDMASVGGLLVWTMVVIL